MHFSCLIIGPNPEAQLAPYAEDLEVEPYPAECDWCGYGDEPTDPECENCQGTGKEMSTRNPSGQWDYWRLGGRWRGFLKLRAGAPGFLGEEGYEWEYERKEGRGIPDWSGAADQALAGDVDWAATIAACTHEKARREYRTYALVCEGVWRESESYHPDAEPGERLVDDPHYLPLWDRLVTNLDPATLVTVVDFHS